MTVHPGAAGMHAAVAALVVEQDDPAPGALPGPIGKMMTARHVTNARDRRVNNAPIVVHAAMAIARAPLAASSAVTMALVPLARSGKSVKRENDAAGRGDRSGATMGRAQADRNAVRGTTIVATMRRASGGLFVKGRAESAGNEAAAPLVAPGEASVIAIVDAAIADARNAHPCANRG